MPVVSSIPTRLVLPPAVRAYANELGIEPCLPDVLDALRRVFADAAFAAVEVHEDPEVGGLRWILFEVEVPWSKEQWRQGMKAWHRELEAACPSPQRCMISLIAYRRP